MVIYIARNIINNEMYIGKTAQTLGQRQKDHFNNAFNKKIQTKFYRALRKYKKDNFEWSIIFTCNDPQKLNESEIFFIDKFDSIENGYNMSPGGDGGNTYHDFSGEKNPFYNLHHSDQTKQMLREKAKQRTQYHFKSGKDNPMYGKNLSPQHRESLSNASCKTWLITFPDQTQITFKSLRKFCLAHNLNYNNVKSAYRDKRLYKNFSFKLV